MSKNKKLSASKAAPPTKTFKSWPSAVQFAVKAEKQGHISKSELVGIKEAHSEHMKK